MNNELLATAKTDQTLAFAILIIAILFVLISAGYLFVLINSVYNRVKEMQQRAVDSLRVINATFADVQETDQFLSSFDIHAGQTGETVIAACTLSCAFHQVDNSKPYAQICETLLPNVSCPP